MRPTQATIGSFLDRVESVDQKNVLAREIFLAQLERWRSLGASPGALVLISLSDPRLALAYFFACLEHGLVPAIVSPACPSRRLAEMIHSMSATYLVCGRPLDLSSISIVRKHQGAGLADIYETGNEPGLVAPGEVVLFTSGTSGPSSAAVFAMEALLRNAKRHAESIGLHRTDRVLVSLPLHFSFTLVAQVFASLLAGAELVLDQPPFTAIQYSTQLSERMISVSSLTPLMIERILASEFSFPASLRVLTVGGDRLGESKVCSLLEMRPEAELYLTYGLTEAGPRVATLAAHREPSKRLSSVGVPLAGTEVRIRPVSGESSVGELFIRSDTLMSRRIGIIDRETSQIDSPDEWLPTGDLFVQDSEGYLYFQGRWTDCLLRNGEKVCLSAVKRIARSIEGVVDARVLLSPQGVPDFDLEIAVSDSSDFSEYDMRQELRRHLLLSEMPKTIILNPELANSEAFK